MKLFTTKNAVIVLSVIVFTQWYILYKVIDRVAVIQSYLERAANAAAEQTPVQFIPANQ